MLSSLRSILFVLILSSTELSSTEPISNPAFKNEIYSLLLRMSMSVMSRLQRVRFGLTSLLVISSIGATFLTQLYADRNATEKNPPLVKTHEL